METNPEPRGRRQQARWVLAFDASCGTCRKISGAVAGACDGKLEVLPLAHPDVRQWREQSLGSRAAWAPTLIKIQASDVRAWTGTAMGIALMRHLGPRSTMRVLRALGQRLTSDQTAMRGQKGIPLLGIGAGFLAVAGSLMMTKPPSGGGGSEDPHFWVEANKDRLPRSYDEVITHTIPYRNAILLAVPAEVRAQLWTEHMNRYRAEHPGISADQTEVIDRAVALVSTLFVLGEDVSDEVQRLEEVAKQAFGRDEARALLSTLGPPDSEVTAQQVLCDCSVRSDYCPDGTGCKPGAGGCETVVDSCGTFRAFDCVGLCVRP